MTSTQSQFTSNLADFWKDDFAPLRTAGQAVLATLREEEAAPDADLYRRIATSSPGSHAYFSKDVDVGLEWKHVQSNRLPAVLTEKLAAVQSHSFMGILAAARLAWMSVDHKLFLFSLKTAESDKVLAFEIPTKQCVVSVGLVRPKKGVFREVVKWVVVVTTPQDVYILALVDDNASQSQPESEDFRLVVTGYTMPTDDVRMFSIAGTESGRIFLGGDDGCVYEIAYEGSVPDRDRMSGSGGIGMDLEIYLDRFYDEGREVTEEITVDSNIRVTYGEFKPIAMGKRAWSSLVGDDLEQPRKCQKFNRSSNSILRLVLPDVMTKQAEMIFGGSYGTSGAVIQLVVDEERQTLYTLGDRGWICSFDLRSESQDGDIRLAGVVDTVKTSRLYLEAVARGQVVPPSTFSNNSLGSVVFPGGSQACQAGVGGMDGARSILKIANSPARGTNGSTQGGDWVLKPASLHVIDQSESSRVTLMAVTKGGIRLYFSVLAPDVINHGPASALQNISRSRTRSSVLAPHRRFTLCHIRVPPMNSIDKMTPDAQGMIEGAVSPRYSTHLKVDAAWYQKGSFVAATRSNVQMQTRGNSLNTGHPGDVIVAACRDSISRIVAAPVTPAIGNGSGQNPEKEEPTQSSPGGISETISFPISTAYGVMDNESTLPGGIIQGIASLPKIESSACMMSNCSTTPSDSELGLGIPPAYYPPARVRKRDLSKNRQAPVPRSTSTELVGTHQWRVAMSILVHGFSQWLLPRPLRPHPLFLVQSAAKRNEDAEVEGSRSYRMSLVDASKGFSSTAEEKRLRRVIPGRKLASKELSSKSARLRQWLIRPLAAPLGIFSKQHFATEPEEIVAINAGGLHFFEQESLIQKLSSAIIASGERVREDAAVTKFFSAYGYKEGCALCIALALGCGPAKGNATLSVELRRKAMDAAFARGLVPKLTVVPLNSDVGDGSSGGVFTTDDQKDSLIPRGFAFKPSALCDSLFTIFARLVRPIWHKPAVVVTEGPRLKNEWSSRVTHCPAKVEAALNQNSFIEVETPLRNLQQIMKTKLSRAINSVPGMSLQESNTMDIDDGGMNERSQYLTRALQYHGQSRTVNHGDVAHLSPYEAENIARLLEEKNIHSLYRLLSRVVQLLELVYLLWQAQNSDEFREVDWGLLHGLTFSQLSETLEGQDRLETLLNSLVTNSVSDDCATTNLSAQSDRLVDTLCERCYLFFSPGWRYAYIGIRKASQAVSSPSHSAMRTDLVREAGDCFLKAAQHWRSATLVTGRLLQKRERDTYEDMALRALKYGSPLAAAVEVLVKLDEVEKAVRICLVVASNFKVAGAPRDSLTTESLVDVSEASSRLGWEYNLYHRRREPTTSEPAQPSSAMTSVDSKQIATYGVDVTAQDAVETCYALIFHYLSTVLKSPNRRLSTSMLEECSGAADGEFRTAFFLYLLDSGNVDTLLTISSPELETWLRSKDNPDLLWRYFIIHGRHREAGHELWTKASDLSSKMLLSDRIEYLSKALNALQSAMQDAQVGAKLNTGELAVHTKEVDETLQVARIQSQILHSIESHSIELTGEISSDMLESLKTSLVPVSDLYNSYAVALHFYDVCLKIRLVCRHDDPEATRITWKQIICKEILPCVTRTETNLSFLKSWVSEVGRSDQVRSIADAALGLPVFENGDWVAKVEGKVVSLGQQLYGSDFVFPPKLLLAYMEDLCHSVPSILKPEWPLLVLAKIGVPYLVILDTYEGIVLRESNSFVGGGEEDRWTKQVIAIIELMRTWVRAAGGDGAARQELARAVTSGRLLPKLDSIRSKLETFSNTLSLKEEIRSIQIMIEDLV